MRINKVPHVVQLHGRVQKGTNYLSLFFRMGWAKILMCTLALLMSNWATYAQTFVKQINGMGITDPKVFKNILTSDYYLTASDNNFTYISQLNAAGTILSTRTLNFSGDIPVIKDMVVDQIDGSLAGIAIGTNYNYIFKYNYISNTFYWIKSFSKSYFFENIHYAGPLNYLVTGEMLKGGITIFEVDRIAGAMNYQTSGFTGEFFSAFDGTDIYGACRYYSGASTFNPCVYSYNATTGTNTWTTGYISNTGTIRMYPVAPIVDGTNVITFCSGSANTFDTYLTGFTDLWLFETDLSGSLSWTKQITIPGYRRLNAKKIINTATGYYLLVDAYNGTFTNFFFVIKTDKSGNLQWINRYGIAQTNTVISGVEDNGDLYLTAQSGSYSPNTNMLFLKLDTSGLSGPGCPFIQPATATITPYGNNPGVKGTTTNTITYLGTNFTAITGNTATTEIVHCNSSGGTGGGGGASLPCNTLSGSLSNGVLAFYPFGYGSLYDLSGNGFDLTNSTTASMDTDRSMNTFCAYRFIKANGDYLTIPAANSWFLNGITNGAFSISLWYKPRGIRPVTDYEVLIGRGTSGIHCPDTWSEWDLALSDCRKAVAGLDQYSHWETPSGSLPCSTLLSNISNIWHHMAFVYDGYGTYNLYIDGNLYSNSTGPCGALSANTGPLMLGVDYTGDLDDVIIYNRAITTAEIAALMAMNGSCCDGYTLSNRPGGNNIIKHASTQNIALYPNATDGLVNISSVKSIIRIVHVYDNTGRIAGTYYFDRPDVSFDISKLPAGIYFVNITTDTENIVEKLIKK